MDKPKRIQLSRRKGWRMPENTVKVDRTSRWGNPFRIAPGHDAAACVHEFRGYVESRLASGQGYPLTELRGKNLACWCRLDAPCHADVLLEIANRHPAPSGGER